MKIVMTYAIMLWHNHHYLNVKTNLVTSEIIKACEMNKESQGN
jgi:hypothetical protein